MCYTLNMSRNRVLEERCVFPNGITTEWEPASGEALAAFEAGRSTVRELNALAKKEGSFTRYRTIEAEDSFT